MAVITVCNHKGGSGKTTSVLHIGAALGMAGYRVCLIDLDPQGFLTRMLGVGEPPEAQSTIALFDLDARLERLGCIGFPHFDLLPSSTTLTKIMRRLNKPIDVLWVKETIEKGHDYDVILIDTAAAITVFSLNALVACRHALIPVMPEFQPVEGAEQTYRTCRMVQQKLNPSLTAAHFLLTSVDGRKNSHQRYRAYLRRTYGERVFEQIVRTSASLAQRVRDGMTVYERDMSSRGALDYINVTDELIRRLGLSPRSEAAVLEAVGSTSPDSV